MNIVEKILVTLFFTILLTPFLFSQNGKEEVRISPKAETMQTVGVTEIKVDYGKPGVKNRVIWGSLVPYEVIWRAGANEATKIFFENDVLIEGKKLKAGSYSFFVVPSKDEWTVIFNKVADQWGAFEYNEAEDALRFKVKPQKNRFTEWLTYEITKTGDYTAEISLQWENVKIPFEVKTKF